MEYNSFEFILAVAGIMWLFIDWAKPLWTSSAYARYISIAVALAGAAAITATFGLDLLVAIGIAADVTIVGHVFAALAIAAGSALLNQIGKRYTKQELILTDAVNSSLHDVYDAAVKKNE